MLKIKLRTSLRLKSKKIEVWKREAKGKKIGTIQAAQCLNNGHFRKR